ncbi:MAG TPA: GDYXXLXY domain-containing protein [Aromatoleum sp.]|uniref:GDYXXLXY domain-containing protein n=1 Tax=Aromatoleum sp. TaxID=2307007 RepID=UPI002B4A20DA|nr:GDYXXLXY domain-containing protein [Aromatoleum sp.]HJV25510.1 GDYXXLXY domain-containing protein [Aromatoleum sp.]
MSRIALRVALLASLLLVAAAAFVAVTGNERILREGRIVLLHLAPVDPRSLMQGDYMALRYAIESELPAQDSAHGYAHVGLDAQGRATFVAVADELPADPALVGMKLRWREHRLSVGPNGFFFQEGRAADFAAAKWGEFRVDEQGKALLTHLRAEDLSRLGENRR